MKTTLELVKEHGTVRTYAHNYTLGVDNSVYEFDKEEMEAFRKACVEEFVKEQKPVDIWLTQKEFDTLKRAQKTDRETIPLYALKGEIE